MAQGYSVKETGAQKLAKKLSGQSMKGAVLEGTQKGMFRIEAYVKDPILSGKILKVRTGTLKSRVFTKVEDKKSRIVGTLANPTKYAAIHEFGGIITPKKGPYLTFQIGGKWVKVAKVTIPARKPHLEGIKAKFPALQKDVGDAIVRRLN